MLEVKNIVVHYGSVKVLNGITLEAKQGTVTTLIGANGAGKSTCLRAISGLVRISSGEILFQGRKINGLSPDKIVGIGIGHVPEGKRLFLEMSVTDNLLTGAFLRRDNNGIQRDINRIYEYFPALAKARHRQASNLSGGEQQMLAIGRGLMANPKFLILDEPSLGLSPILANEVASIIKQIANQGLSVLLVEQNANLALQLASKCYVLETGRIALEGDAKQLQANEYVRRAYLGL